jgi:protein-disulfide isomerase
MKRCSFRDLSTRLGAFAVAATLFLGTISAQAADKNAILNDPSAPVAGNPKGDVTIVAFFDYNCPFCKKAAPALDKLVKSDGGIRLIYKDWPILTEASVYGARMALAAQYQGKYDVVHQALMGIPGRKISQDQMQEAIKASGVDMVRLNADLTAHEQDISSLLKRNLEQADSLGLQGTPAFLIGPYLVAQALDDDGFRQAVADARYHAKAR